MRPASVRFQEISHDAMNFFRLSVKVTVPLSRKNNQLGIWNTLRQNISTSTMRHVTDNEVIVVADKDKRWHSDVFQPSAGIMGLPRQYMAEVKFYRTEIDHSYLKVFLDKLHVLVHVGLCPTHDDGVLSHVLLIAHLDHFLGDPQRNTCLARVRGATGRKNQLAHLTGMIQRQQLSYPSAHGMSAHNGAFKA